MEQVSYSLATIIKGVTGKNQVPMYSWIQSCNFIYAAVDNFDKNDGKVGNHDTVLMFSQNNHIADTE